MSTTINNLGAAALSAILLCTFAGNGWAQSGTKDSGFGAAQIRNLQSRNSAGQFSADNVRNNVINRSVGRAGVAGVNQRNFLSTSSSPLSQPSKPFSSLSRGPSVNPYLALSAPRASASDYYNVIRPQQQQQRSNQQQIQAIRQQRRLSQLAARAPYSTTGDANSAPTGHVAVFQSLGSYQNTGNYFPPPSAPKRRR